MLFVSVARSSSNYSTLWTSGFVDDVRFSHNGAYGTESKTTLCFVEFDGCQHQGKVAVYTYTLLNFRTHSISGTDEAIGTSNLVPKY